MAMWSVEVLVVTVANRQAGQSESSDEMTREDRHQPRGVSMVVRWKVIAFKERARRIT
jgi:hypothetical protein